MLTVMRYVERNAVRAKSIPVRKVENWPWSSAGKPLKGVEPPPLDPGPVPRGKDWSAWVNRAITEAELLDLRESLMRGRPYGCQIWQQRAAKRLGLESSLRPRGRPKKVK